MKLSMKLLLALLFPVILTQNLKSNISSSDTLPFKITENTIEGDPNYKAPYFPLPPFQKFSGNPILTPNPSNDWESAFLYNPTALILNSTIFLLYRAQNARKTSSIGLAWSTDGTNFTRLNEPIISPTEKWEEIGGCEDPRIVRVNGTFYVTYTAYNNVSAQLVLATSEDLLSWRKYPPLFPGYSEYFLLVYMHILFGFGKH